MTGDSCTIFIEILIWFFFVIFTTNMVTVVIAVGETHRKLVMDTILENTNVHFLWKKFAKNHDQFI